MKTNKLTKAIVLMVLSAVMSLCAVACTGGGSKKFTVTLDANGGVIANNQTSVEVTLNKDYSLPIPTKEDYDFVAWKQGTSTIATTGKWTIEGNISLKAEWVEKTYTITFDADGGEGLTQNTITGLKKGDLYQLPINLTKAGYEFEGWMLNGTLVQNVAEWNYKENITLVAKWVGATTQVTISANGGQGLDNEVVIVTKGEVLTLPTLTREGYTFAGWLLNEQPFDPSTPWSLDEPTATITAQWNANSYTVTIDVNGGDALSNNTVTVKVGEVIVLPSVTKTNCQVDKWLVNGNEVDVTAPWSIGGDVTIVVQWTAATTAITFDENGGVELAEADKTATFTFGELVALPTTTKVGYNLVGWKLNETLYTSTSVWDLADANATLVAQWVAKNIPVNFNVDGGEAISGTTFTYNEKPYESVEDIPTTTKEHYTFDKWLYNGAEIDLTAIWTTDVDEIELVAKWIAKKSSVTFDENGGVELAEADKTATFTYGEPVALPTTTKVGYDLAGWKLGNVVYTSESIWDISTAEVTLEAVWTGKVIPVTFNSTNGSAVEATTFTFGEKPYASASEIPVPEKEFCTFDAWLYNGEAIDLTAVWAEDVEAIELVAKWSGTEINVTIKYGVEGIEDDEAVVVYGDMYDFSYVRPGYTLVKYVIEGTETEVAVSGDVWVYDEDVTIVAVWSMKTYSVTVKDYNGAVLAEMEVIYGDNFSLTECIPSQDSIYVEIMDEEYPRIVEMFFDGFKIEGTEVKYVYPFDSFVWTYDGEDVNVTIVPTYDSLDKWM